MLAHNWAYLAVCSLRGQGTDDLDCCLQVKHRGRSSAADAFETMSMPLPKASRRIKKKHPRFGKRSFLQLETMKYDIKIPTTVRIGTLSYTGGHVKILTPE